MFKFARQFMFCIGAFLLCARIPIHAQDVAAPSTPPDSTLFTSYFFGSNYQSLTWIVCGSTQQSEGCYGAGGLGPFGKVGAMIEGDPVVKGDTVTRGIFIVDVNGTGGSVQLYGYKKVDVVSASSDTTTVTLIKQITLPLTGGGNATCTMVANKRFLYVTTDQSQQVLQIQKSNLQITTLGFSQPITITTDAYGFVTITSGGFSGSPGYFEQFNPDGEGVQDGGGSWFMLNTETAVSTGKLPPAEAQPPVHLGYHMKSAQPKQ